MHHVDRSTPWDEIWEAMDVLRQQGKILYVGSSNFERDQEMSLAQNAREMLEQAQLALRLFESGEYGTCESCGQPIGKDRLQVFPRATLCVPCKQREERR